MGARATVASLRRGMVIVRRGAQRWSRPPLSTWRRSLQLRVVSATIVLSLTVIALIGDFLVDRIAQGLLDAKVDAALDVSLGGARTAQESFDNADLSDRAVLSTLSGDLVSALSRTTGHAGRTEVLLRRAPEVTATDAPLTRTSSFSVSPRNIPDALREQVLDNPSRQSWTSVQMAYEGSPPVPGIAVGSRVQIPDVGPYELYFLFPLDQEARTLELVRRTLLVAGVALVLLVGAVAWIVTRAVVTPVRMAARISERLAAGRLEERMLVRGEDDLARLAASFNKMATNLQRQISQLEDLSRVQRRFVSDVSHELRTPLTTVRMAADVLHEARAGFDPAVARSAELLQTQLDRFESLLSDLLEISRFDAGAASLEAEPVDLLRLAALTIEAAEPLAERKGTTVTLHGANGACLAELDSRRIDRILRNLIVNAIEHSEGRPIEVFVACDDDAAAVAVRDHGVGLRPGESSLVFNRFWRADPARARTTGGTGLGLSIAVEDAHLHDGWLQAWGEPGDGTQFRLTVPRRRGVELIASPIPLEPVDSRRRRGGSARRAAAPYSRPVPTAANWPVRRG
jgi:two-component system sensor histidine kinase MtrB